MSFILLGILNSQVEAGGGGAFDLLQTTVLSSSAASVTFSSLGSYSQYKHLQIRATHRLNAAFTGDGSCFISVNNYGGGLNDIGHQLYGNGSSVISGSDGSGNIFWSPLNNAVSNSFGALIVDVLDFNNTNKNPVLRSFSGHASGSDGTKIVLSSGLYAVAGAVTSIKIDSNGSNWRSGSRFSLYGIK